MSDRTHKPSLMDAARLLEAVERELTRCERQAGILDAERANGGSGANAGRKRAFCALCHREVNATRDGGVWSHRDPDGTPCPCRAAAE